MIVFIRALGRGRYKPVLRKLHPAFMSPCGKRLAELLMTAGVARFPQRVPGKLQRCKTGKLRHPV